MKKTTISHPKYFVLTMLLVIAGSLCAQTPLPYRQTFDDVSDFETFIVADENGDQQTWRYDDIDQAASNERDYDADDWLITPVFELDKGKTYLLAFKAYNEMEGTETIAVWMGNGRRVSSMTISLLPATAVSTTDKQTFSAIFTVEESDDYRIGFHHCTTGDPYSNHFFIDDITLEETTSLAAPAPVSELVVTPGDKGALNATISLHAPEQTIDQQVLTEITKVTLYRDNLLIHTFDTPTPGVTLTYYDNEGVTNGLHTYKAIATNNQGNSNPTETKAYIGKDVPGAVENLHFIYDYDTHEALVTWDAPTIGFNGGYIDPSTIRYSLRKYPMTSDKTITPEPISETRYEDYVDIAWLDSVAEERYRETEEQFHYPVAHTIVIDGQGRTCYYVKAVNDIGSGPETTSESCLIGDAYTLPFEESFPDGWSTHFWYKPVTPGRSRWYELSDNRFSQDGDNGFLAFTASVNDESQTSIEETAMAQSGRLCMTDVTNPYISLYYLYAYAMAYPLLVKVSTDGQHFTTVATLDTSSEANAGRYIRAIVPLSGIAGAKSCYVALESTIVNTTELIYVDNILIYDQKNHDLTAKISHLPSHLRSDEARTVTVTVSNMGDQDVAEGSYTIDVLVNGRVAGSTAGPAVKALEMTDANVAVTASVNAPALCDILVRVNYDTDQNLVNNLSVGDSIKVQHPSYPTPRTLVVADNDGRAILQWQAPLPPRTTDEAVTDSFEDYADFTISDMGDWVLIDGDRRLTYSWGEDYNWPNRTRPHAFIVMTPSEVELPNTGGKGLSSNWQAHTGEKMLMSSSAISDDWLISTELSGRAQTITFYARATNSYTETFDVRYSTTDTEPESFTRLGNEVSFIGSEWKLYSYNLPEGSRHFAIHKTSDDGFMFFIDDVTFIPDTLARQDIILQGYNIYCNGERVNEALVTQTTYTDPTDRGDAIYTVTAVYDKGESACSNEAYIVSGISEVGPTPVATDGLLYDLMGRPTTGKQKGIYIKGGKKILKIED